MKKLILILTLLLSTQISLFSQDKIEGLGWLKIGKTTYSDVTLIANQNDEILIEKLNRKRKSFDSTMRIIYERIKFDYNEYNKDKNLEKLKARQNITHTEYDILVDSVNRISNTIKKIRKHPNITQHLDDDTTYFLLDTARYWNLIRNHNFIKNLRIITIKDLAIYSFNIKNTTLIFFNDTLIQIDFQNSEILKGLIKKYGYNYNYKCNSNDFQIKFFNPYAEPEEKLIDESKYFIGGSNYNSQSYYGKYDGKLEGTYRLFIGNASSYIPYFIWNFHTCSIFDGSKRLMILRLARQKNHEVWEEKQRAEEERLKKL